LIKSTISSAFSSFRLLKNGHSLKEINCCEQEALKLRKERVMAIRLQRELMLTERKLVACVV
jgi:hypothetical protein